MNGSTKLLISAGIIGLAASYMATKMDPGKSGAPARAAETTRPAEPVRSAGPGRRICQVMNFVICSRLTLQGACCPLHESFSV